MSDGCIPGENIDKWLEKEREKNRYFFGIETDMTTEHKVVEHALIPADFRKDSLRYSANMDRFCLCGEKLDTRGGLLRSDSAFDQHMKNLDAAARGFDRLEKIRRWFPADHTAATDKYIITTGEAHDILAYVDSLEEQLK